MTAERTILLTGASGLLGGQILRNILLYETSSRIIVLLRGDPTLVPNKFEKLIEDDGVGEFRHRIEPFWADLEQDNLGLTPSQLDASAEPITHIIHSAAAVDFALPYSAARSSNYDGTVRLVDFARRAKNLRAFAQISTAHVAGRRTGYVSEDELEHSAGFVNNYERTKYESEVFLRAQMGEMPIAVYRTTSLVGNASTGSVRQFNFFHNAIRLIYHGLLPALPGDPQGHIDLIPVDWAAFAIRYLALDNFQAGKTYHICAEPAQSYQLQELIDATVAVYNASPYSKKHNLKPLLVLPTQQYRTLLDDLHASGRDGKVNQLMQPLNYFVPHLGLPKVFGASNLHRDSGDAVAAAPDIRSYYPQIVEYCLQTQWGKELPHPDLLKVS